MVETPRQMPDADIFVPSGQEVEYLAAHGIEIIVLPNGARIFGALRRVEDSNTANIEYRFRAGAENEEAGKTGGSHVMEHLIARDQVFESSKFGNHSNATTAAAYFNITLGGIANPDVRKFGIWPILPIIESQIQGKGELRQEDLDAEIENVLSENSMREADPNNLIARHLNRIMFAPGNPLTIDPIGIESDIRSLTLEDMHDLRDKIFSSDILDAYFYVDGDERVYEAIKEHVFKAVSEMTKKSPRFKEAIPSNLDLLNPDFVSGQTYVADTGLKNGRVLIRYAWIGPMGLYTKSNMANSYLMEAINGKLFEYSRRNGISYVTSASSSRAYDLVSQSLGLEMPSGLRSLEDFAANLYPDLLRNVIGGFSMEDLEQIVRIKNLGMKASPVTVSERANAAFGSYTRAGRIIDHDRLNEELRNIKASDLEEQRQLLLSTSPTTFIVGDIRK